MTTKSKAVARYDVVYSRVSVRVTSKTRNNFVPVYFVVSSVSNSKTVIVDKSKRVVGFATSNSQCWLKCASFSMHLSFLKSV